MTQSTQTQTANEAAPAPTHMRAPVPVQTRSERFTSTDVSEFPAVTGREPMWKYTPVARIARLFEPGLDGSRYDYELSSATGTGSFSAEWVRRDHALIGAAGIPEEKASANAWTSFDDALQVQRVLAAVEASAGAGSTWTAL